MLFYSLMEIISLDTNSNSNLHFEMHYSHLDIVLGVVQISHGMAEHKVRYQHFIDHLNSEGFHVAIYDHRGHGNRIIDKKIGYFAKKSGWSCVVNDLIAVHQKTNSLFPDLPKILLGHSMGSWISLSAMQQETVFNMLLLSGSSYPNSFETVLQKILLKIEILRLGAQGYSKFIHRVIFGGFNSKFEDAVSPNDWLSRDFEVVKKYTEDSLCGFVVSNQLWLDVVNGVESVFTPIQLRLIDKNIPILVFSGSEDPVGSMGKGTQKLHDCLVNIGCKSKLYLVEGARHETLNETDKMNTYNYVLSFLKKNL